MMTNQPPRPQHDADVAVHVDSLTFGYGGPSILEDVSLSIKKGSRCLLVGANGAGKSTLLRLLSGKNLVKAKMSVLGKNPFYDGSVGITYLGTEWAHNPIVRRDVPVARLLKSLGAERHQERCAELLDILDVNPNWHMHEVSDGQRRRVQIVLGLLEPWDLLLLDEVTVDLDVLVRCDLLKFLQRETETRGATIIYATHIFDGLGNWPTQVVHMAHGKIDLIRLKDDFPELQEARRGNGVITNSSAVVDNSPLLTVVEQWLRKDAQKGRESSANHPGPLPSKWDILSENMKAYGDKYFNYWR